MNNRKAQYNYELLDTYTAGIVLTSGEVRSVKDGKISFNDAYCVITNGEAFLKKMHIYIKDGSDTEFLRDRKLLLNKKEIQKLERAIKEKGLTIVPTSMYVNKTGLIKVDVALARGKKTYDKRESIKKKDQDRQSVEY